MIVTGATIYTHVAITTKYNLVSIIEKKKSHVTEVIKNRASMDIWKAEEELRQNVFEEKSLKPRFADFAVCNDAEILANHRISKIKDVI